jgi:hypothetical protein
LTSPRISGVDLDPFMRTSLSSFARASNGPTQPDLDQRSTGCT